MLSESEKLVLEACTEADSINPVTREMLKDITKQADNQNRILIGNLREHGYRIISDNNNGYWLAKTDDEYRVWIKKYIGYAVTIFRRKCAMDRNITGQIEMEV